MTGAFLRRDEIFLFFGHLADHQRCQSTSNKVFLNQFKVDQMDRSMPQPSRCMICPSIGSLRSFRSEAEAGRPRRVNNCCLSLKEQLNDRSRRRRRVETRKLVLSSVSSSSEFPLRKSRRPRLTSDRLGRRKPLSRPSNRDRGSAPFFFSSQTPPEWRMSRQNHGKMNSNKSRSASVVFNGPA